MLYPDISKLWIFLGVNGVQNPIC